MSYKGFLFNMDNISIRYVEPVWWYNFFIENGYGPTSLEDTLATYNAKLQSDNAKYPYGNQYLVFEEESDFSAFLLKWS